MDPFSTYIIELFILFPLYTFGFVTNYYNGFSTFFGSKLQTLIGIVFYVHILVI
ncbi:hypothetical protein ACJIZ3_003739 [Penstemon smallii]|uniref:Uncharacterized protein n=1 Tax=Penstemon smallii TaxID=265156 RepID=A0ABD3UA57_9LAMI